MTRTLLVIDIQNDYFRVALCRFGSPRTRRPASPLLSEKRAHPAIKSCW